MQSGNILRGRKSLSQLAAWLYWVSCAAAEKEPITPFLHKIVPLYKQHGVSTLMVVGGSGDYFDVADLVILMHEYSASCVTKEAKEVAHTFNFSVPRQVRFVGCGPCWHHEAVLRTVF